MKNLQNILRAAFTVFRFMLYNRIRNRKERGKKVILHKYILAKHFYTAEKNRLIEQSMNYSFLFLKICFFFTFSFAGWLWEVFLHVYLDHALVNRGVLYGPWLPIYGFGVLILFLLRRFAKKPHMFF